MSIPKLGMPHIHRTTDPAVDIIMSKYGPHTYRLLWFLIECQCAGRRINSRDSAFMKELGKNHNVNAVSFLNDLVDVGIFASSNGYYHDVLVKRIIDEGEAISEVRRKSAKGIKQNNETIVVKKGKKPLFPIDPNEALNLFNDTRKEYVPNSRLVRIIDVKTKRQINMINNNGYVLEDLEHVTRMAFLDAYHIETGYKYVTLEYLTRSSTWNRYIVLDVPTNVVGGEKIIKSRFNFGG